MFTAFTMAGFGMAKYHHKRRERGWRHKLVINFSAGVTSLVVVLIFAVVKFTEGAWLVLIVFAVGVPALIRLNRHYRMEAEVLEHIGTGDHRQASATPPSYSRRTVYVFVDEFDLATLAGLRYARSLRPTSLRAVHFALDSAQADRLRDDWVRANTGVTLDLVDCPDRRIAKAAAEMVMAEASLPGVGVTAVMPRRTYTPLLGRLLHDRTADRMASVVSQIPHAAATIVPFDVRTRVESLAARAHARAAAAAQDTAAQDGAETGGADGDGAGRDGGRRGAAPDQAARSQALAEVVAEASRPDGGKAPDGDGSRPGQVTASRPRPVTGSRLRPVTASRPGPVTARTSARTPAPGPLRCRDRRHRPAPAPIRTTARRWPSTTGRCPRSRRPRSAACPGAARPSWKAACTRSRSGRSSTTRCSLARSWTPPGSSPRCSTAGRTFRVSTLGLRSG